MFSIFSRFQGISQAFRLAIKRIVLLSIVSMMRRLFARMEEPVSVRSTMPSSNAGLDFRGAPGEFDGDVHAALLRNTGGWYSPVRWQSSFPRNL